MAAAGGIREEARTREPLEKSSLFNAKFVPFGGEDSTESYELDQVIYRSQTGGLLDVQHDMEALAIYDAKYWKALFDQRVGKASWPSELPNYFDEVCRAAAAPDAGLWLCGNQTSIFFARS